MDTLFNELVAFSSRVIEGDRQSIFLMCSVYCLLVLGYSVIYQCRIRRWPSTTGNLANIGKKLFAADHLRSEKTYTLDAPYQYEVEGKPYCGKRVSAWIIVPSHNVKDILDFQARGVEYLGKDLVRVFYNPNCPRKSFLVQPSLASIMVIALGAVVPLGLYLYHYI